MLSLSDLREGIERSTFVYKEALNQIIMLAEAAKAKRDAKSKVTAKES